jgi:hypothetical protein
MLRTAVAIAGVALALALALSSADALARDIYVSSETGANDNDGTKEKPKKLLWRVMGELQAGDHVRVAEGRQEGQGKSGVMPPITVSGVTLEGGWAKDFSARDPFKHLTIIEADPENAGSNGTVFAVATSDNKAFDVTIDGFCIDRGPGNVYVADGEPGANKRIEGHADSSPWGYRELNRKQSSTNPVISLIGQGAFTVRNCLIVNAAWWGIYVKCGGSGTTTIENNLVLSCQDVGIEAIAGGGWGKPTIVVRNNTVAFATTMGSARGRALSIDPKNGDQGKVVVEGNVLAYCDGSGVDPKFPAKGDCVQLKGNLFYFNRRGDFSVADEKGCAAKDFEDELTVSASGNVHEVPKFTAKMSRAWFDRWSIREYVDMCAGKFNTWEKLKAAREALGLGEYEIPGYDKKYPDYKSLPQKRNNYNQSRYPHPMKKGESMNWAEAVIPLVGADAPRGVMPLAGK